jgi:hypothetical protein
MLMRMSPRKAVFSTVYSSVATSPFTDADLAALLTVSRRNNAAAGITGMLLYRDGRFLQVLEGQPEAVEAAMARISADSGHRQVRVLLAEMTPARQFPEWTMGYPQVGRDVENAIPGYRSTFQDLADDDAEASAIAPAVRALIRWYQSEVM